MREPKTEGRIIRKGLMDSERWLTLKDNADRLAYVSLLLNCDDYGNFSAERYRLMRLWRDFGITTIELVAKTLSELQDHDMILLYDADSRPFVHVNRLYNTKQWWTRAYPKSPAKEDINNENKQRHTKQSINHDLSSHKLGVRGLGLGESQNPSPRPKRAVSNEGIELRRKVWTAYSNAYQDRYGVPPADNAEARSAIKRFCSQIPESDCAAVAAFYLTHNAAFYVGKGHNPKLLMSDAAKLRTEWATGKQITQTEATQRDKTAARHNIYRSLQSEVDNEKF